MEWTRTQKIRTNLKIFTNSHGTYNVEEYGPTPGGPRATVKVIKPKSHPSCIGFGGHGRLKGGQKIVQVQPRPRRATAPRQRKPDFIDLTEDQKACQEIFMDESCEDPKFVPKMNIHEARIRVADIKSSSSIKIICESKI